MPLRSSTAGDPYAPADTMTRSALSRPRADSITQRTSIVDCDAIDERLGDDREVLSVPRRVEVRERGVPTNCLPGVDRRRCESDGGVEIVDGVEPRQADTGSGIEHGAMERRQVAVAIRAGVDRGFGPAQVGLDLGERPPVAPFVVVRTGAPDDEAGVVGGATADDPRARGRPVGRLRLPEVGHRKDSRVEHVRRPPSARMAAVVRARLDEADGPIRVLAQPGCKHATRRPASDDEHVEPLRHPTTLRRSPSQKIERLDGVALAAEDLVDERDDARIRVELVRQLLQPVSLVVVDEELGPDPALGDARGGSARPRSAARGGRSHRG